MNLLLTYMYISALLYIYSVIDQFLYRFLKWKSLEHWRRLHAILKIEKETEARRERWRSKIYELIPDYSPNIEFI